MFYKRITPVFLFILLFSPLVTAKKLVYVIQSYHPGYAWVDENNQGLEEVLGRDYELVYFYMDTKRLPPKEFPRRAELAWKIYKAINPDLVMLGDDNALRLLAPKITQENTPFIYYGINNNPRDYFKVLPKNVTGVLERNMISRGVVYLSQLLPMAKKVKVIGDGTPTSKAVMDDVFDGKESKKAGMIMEYSHLRDWSNYKSMVLSIHETHQALALVNFFSIRDEAGKVVDFNQVATWTSKHAKVPVFGFHKWVVRDDGAMGGYPLLGTEHGRIVGEMVVEILTEDKSPSDMVPRVDRQGQLYLNSKQLERFGIEVPVEIKEDAIFN